MVLTQPDTVGEPLPKTLEARKNGYLQKEIANQVQAKEKEVMSLKPEPIGPIPQETVVVNLGMLW